MKKPKQQKGNCFQAHANFLLEETHFDEKDVRLCHGTAELNQGIYKGKRTAHAWIEFCRGQMVLECSNERAEKPVICARNAFYRAGKIKARSVVRYTLSEMKVNLRKSGNYGAWVNFEDEELHGRISQG